MRQDNRILRGNGRGLLRRRSHRFYTTAERRGTAMKKGINTDLSEAKTLLGRKKKNAQ